jgi:hypothetical protein
VTERAVPPPVNVNGRLGGACERLVLWTLALLVFVVAKQIQAISQLQHC